MAEITLGNVVSTFPVGTKVGAYLGAVTDAGNPQPQGEVLQTATVDNDGTLTFTFPANGQTYTAAASLEKDETGADVYRILRFAAPVPPPGLTPAEVLTQLEEHEALTTEAHGGILTADALEDEEATRLAADEALEKLIEELTVGPGITEEEVQALVDVEKTAREGADTAHAADTTGVHGIADTSALALKSEVATDAELSAHEADTTSVHGIADTSKLATKEEVAAKQDSATAATDAELTAHAADSTSVHGIADTSLLALKSELSGGGSVDMVFFGKTLGTARPEAEHVIWVGEGTPENADPEADIVIDQAGFTRERSHTFHLTGKLATATLLGFRVSAVSGETVALTAMHYLVGSATNAKFSLLLNGSKITGFKEKTATTTEAETTGEVELKDGDRIGLQIESLSGEPERLAVDVVLTFTR